VPQGFLLGLADGGFVDDDSRFGVATAGAGGGEVAMGAVEILGSAFGGVTARAGGAADGGVATRLADGAGAGATIAAAADGVGAGATIAAAATEVVTKVRVVTEAGDSTPAGPFGMASAAGSGFR